MEYALWGEVQAQLVAYRRQTGTICSFMEGARALKDMGLCRSADTLPRVSFQDWDIHDCDDLCRRIDQTPVVVVDHQTAYYPVGGSIASAFAPSLSLLPLRIPHNPSVNVHADNAFQFLFVVRGSGLLTLTHGAVELHPNTFCILSARTVHDITCPSPDGVVLSISVTEQTVAQTLSRLFRENNLISDFFRTGLSQKQGGYLLFPVEDPDPILLLFRTLLHEAHGRPNGEYFSQCARANLLELLLIYLLRLGETYERHTAMPAANGSRVPILAILQHIQREWRTASLEEIAAQFHFDRSYLSKQIKAHTGKTFTQLVSELRMEEAKRLLQHTDQSVEQVAEACGYNSADHFSRSFLSAEGLRPSAWRKHMCTHASL